MSSVRVPSNTASCPSSPLRGKGGEGSFVRSPTARVALRSGSGRFRYLPFSIPAKLSLAVPCCILIASLSPFAWFSVDAHCRLPARIVPPDRIPYSSSFSLSRLASSPSADIVHRIPVHRYAPPFPMILYAILTAFRSRCASRAMGWLYGGVCARGVCARAAVLGAGARTDGVGGLAGGWQDNLGPRRPRTGPGGGYRGSGDRRRASRTSHRSEPLRFLPGPGRPSRSRSRLRAVSWLHGVLDLDIACAWLVYSTTARGAMGPSMRVPPMYAPALSARYRPGPYSNDWACRQGPIDVPARLSSAPITVHVRAGGRRHGRRPNAYMRWRAEALPLLPVPVPDEKADCAVGRGGPWPAAATAALVPPTRMKSMFDLRRVCRTAECISKHTRAAHEQRTPVLRSHPSSRDTT